MSAISTHMVLWVLPGTLRTIVQATLGKHTTSVPLCGWFSALRISWTPSRGLKPLPIQPSSVLWEEASHSHIAAGGLRLQLWVSNIQLSLTDIWPSAAQGGREGKKKMKGRKDRRTGRRRKAKFSFCFAQGIVGTAHIQAGR